MSVEYKITAGYGFYMETENWRSFFNRMGVESNNGEYHDWLDNTPYFLSQRGFTNLNLFTASDSYQESPGWGIAIASSMVDFYPRETSGLWVLGPPTGEENEKALLEMARLEDLLFLENTNGWTKAEPLARNWHLISSAH